MNIEIANRLVELRKKMGLSQEELADKLGLSRQAVSKWERAEASPDTDNLICLAKLYGVSLDDLLNTDQSIEDIAKEIKEKQSEPAPKQKDQVRFDSTGIHVRDGKTGEEVHVGSGGIHVHDKDGTKVDIGDSQFKFDWHMSRGWKIAKAITFAIVSVLAITGYFLIGFYYGSKGSNIGWCAWWVLFLLPLIVDSFLDAFRTKKADKVVIPLICVCVYIPLGFYFGLWHPLWVIFLSIPLYYGTVSAFKKDDDKDDDEDDDER